MKTEEDTVYLEYNNRYIQIELRKPKTLAYENIDPLRGEKP